MPSVLVCLSAQETGYSLTDDELNRAFIRFKELADKKKELTSLDLASIVNDEIRDVNIRRYELVGMQARHYCCEIDRMYTSGPWSFSAI